MTDQVTMRRPEPTFASPGQRVTIYLDRRRAEFVASIQRRHGILTPGMVLGLMLDAERERWAKAKTDSLPSAGPTQDPRA